MFDKADYLFKIVLSGNSGVGKSSLLFRFCDDEFHESFLPTIGVDFKIKTVQQLDKSIRLHIWDTAGQERFQTICCMYYKGADGVVIAYDITDRQSFTDVEKWVTQIQEQSTKNAKKILVGNKSDQDDCRQVSYEEGKALADQLGMEFVETSAKEGTKVEEAFAKLALELQKTQAQIGRVLPNVNVVAPRKLEYGRSVSVSQRPGCCL